MDLVVFSKDRPAQLDLLLQSIERHFAEWRTVNLTVVHVAADERAARGYERVRALHPQIAFVDEATTRGTFRDITLSLLGRSPRVAFLMDDQLFKAPFTLDRPELRLLDSDPEVMCVSLRMDPGMDYCYALDRRVPVPAFEDGTVWRWRDADGDWAYPMSLDAHIFRTDELLPLMRALPFANPNTLESALADHPLAHAKLVCLPVAPTVNIPDNRVQDVFANRHGAGDAAALTERFLAGDRLDLEPLIGLRTPSPHHEIPLPWAGLVEYEPPVLPRVSVVVPCFQYGRHLVEAVESALAQEGVDVDVTIVDDGSTDSTPDVAAALAAAHPDRVRVLTTPNSGHPAHPRNAGIRAAAADLLLCLDADDRLGPGYLARCAAALAADPRAGFAYGDFREFGVRTGYQPTEPFDAAVIPTRNLLGTATVFRRAAWEAAGGYDPEVGYEDWDLWIGCTDAGWPGVRVEGAVWEYRVHGAGQFAADRGRDAQIKARIVLKRPHLYTAGQVAWAQAVVAGADVPGGPEGIVPRLAIDAPAEPAGSAVRGFVTVALAHEVAERPHLLAAYGERFAAADDATLVLLAADGDAEAAGSRLVPVLEALGLDGPGSPDMVAVAAPAARVAEAAAAVLTEQEPHPDLAALHRFDAAGADGLRALAETAWGAGARVA
ncbi:MAG TPA: glycosyltransferase [Solirubrobacteraceae bacterium]|nr:glycosyltransferase [Solirubrobacteraceae bacterium]